MKILYFTATGNNLYIAKSIGGELLSIPQLIKENNYAIEDDTVGIIAPVFYGGIPNIVKDYLKKVNIKANYIFTILSYGSCPYASLNVVEKLLNKKNLNLNYANTVLMVDNYLPMFDMEEEIKIKDNTSINENISRIKEDILNKKEYMSESSLSVKILTFLADKLLRPFSEKFFKIKDKNNNCNGCKTCEMICPKGNITVTNNNPIINNNCELCLACVQNCPKKTLATSREKSETRFRNPNIKLSEIIKSNKL